MGRTIYHVIVALSLVIVLLFCGYKIFVRAPEQKPIPKAGASDQSTDNPDTSDIDESQQTPLVRKDEYYTFLLAASDDGNGNADTIMLLSYDVSAQKVGVVSIPRDTLVDTTRSNPKINGAYGKGVDELMDEASDLVGFPIDYYITVDMRAFKALVNKVDGVDFYIPIDMDYDDPTQDLSIHYTEGMKHLNGQQALEVARFRKNNDGSGYADSDISRIDTQQKLLTAMAKKVLSWSSITKIKDFIDIFADYVDTDLSVGDLGWFGTQAMELDTASGISFATLPG
ncbi:MAG: LytR family transcriptional regulator, partial [Clostridia bacterium]|nr:LytR family transcriptional regulator [Clostridia bacterium]